MQKRISIIIALMMTVLVTGCNVNADEESKEQEVVSSIVDTTEDELSNADEKSKGQTVESSVVETTEEVSAIDNDMIPITTEDYTFYVPSSWKGQYKTETRYANDYGYDCLDYNQGDGYSFYISESDDHNGDGGRYFALISMISSKNIYKYLSDANFGSELEYIGIIKTKDGWFHLEMYASGESEYTYENDRYKEMIEELKTCVMDSISANEGNTLERKSNPWEDTELAYQGNNGQMYVPASWDDKYVVEMNYLDYTDNYGYTLDVYEKMDYEEGNGGYLFSLGFFENEEDYNNGRYGEITYLGMMKMEADWIDSKQNVILILPSDNEQYSDKNKETYLQMSGEVQLVVSLFKCWDYCYWMSDDEIETGDIPTVNAYSNYLGNSFSGGGVLSNSLPRLYGLVEQDGVDYYWDTSDTQGLRRIGLQNGYIVAYADWIESSSSYYSVTVGSRLSSDVDWGEPKTVSYSGYKYFMWRLNNGYLIICAYDTSENFSQCEAIAEIHVTDKDLCSVLSMD
jgi:hypothetical protein